MNRSFVWVGVVLLASITSSAMAAVIDGPVVNQANGHTYYLLSQNTWTASQAEALTLGGKLATIRSQAENDFVHDTFANFDGTKHGLWIGYYDPSQDQQGGSHASNFVWVSGETSTFTHWSSGEPNNNMHSQFATYMYPNPNANGPWDDYYLDADTSNAVTPNFGLFGVVEVVPEPSTLVLAGLCLMSVIGFRRRNG